MRVRSLKENALLNIIYTITNLIFPLITYPYASRVLSASGIGRVNFFTAISNYAVMMAALGISTYGVRAVANVREDRGKLQKTVSELLTINLVATWLVLGIYIGMAFWVEQFNRDLALCFINGLIILTTPWGMNWLYSGLEQYDYITKRTIAFKLISLILVFTLVHRQDDYLVYAGILAFSSIGTYICNYIYAKKIIGFCYRPDCECKRHVKPMLILFASSLAISVYINLDTVMLGFICGDREVGLYTTAVKIKTILLSIVNAISIVLLPRLSYYVSQGKEREYKIALKKSFSIIFIITIPVTVFFIVTSLECILILGGRDYVDAVPCMNFLMPILIISGFSNVIGNQILIPKGKDIAFMKAVSAGAIVDLVLNMIFMPKYGCVGAAIATLIAELTQMSIQLAFAQRDVLFNIQWKSILKITLATMLGVILLKCIKNIVSINLLINIGIYATVFFCGYGIGLVVMKEKYSVELMKTLVNKIRG